jgi:3'-phosphoadenosine 5'-phosphosulfate sulfotransferase (PAPS reductase)/FAD synthetase
VLEWALERFAPRIAISTAFQIDGVALDRHGVRDRPEVEVFSVDTGRLPAETYELIERLRDAYPGLHLELLSPNGDEVCAMVGRTARTSSTARSTTGCSAATSARSAR